MKYWTIKQAAEIVDLSPITIRWHIGQGNIKAKKFGRDWMISTKTIDILLSRSKNKSLKETAREYDKKTKTI